MDIDVLNLSLSNEVVVFTIVSVLSAKSQIALLGTTLATEPPPAKRLPLLALTEVTNKFATPRQWRRQTC